MRAGLSGGYIMKSLNSLLNYLFLLFCLNGYVFGDIQEEWLSIIELYDNGNYKEAYNRSQQYLLSDSDAIDILYSEVKAALHLTNAEDYYDTWKSFDGEDYLGLYRSYIINYYFGYAYQARHISDKIKGKFPSDKWYDMRRGEMAQYFGNDDSASVYYSRATQNDLTRPTAIWRLLRLNRAYSNLIVQDSLSEILFQYPVYANQAQMNRIWNIGKRGNWPKAISKSVELRETNKNASTTIHLARIYNHLGIYYKAKDILEDGLRNWPENVAIADMLSWVYEITENYEAKNSCVSNMGRILQAYYTNSAHMEFAEEINDTLLFEREARQLIRMNPGYDYPIRVLIDWLDERRRQASADSLENYLKETISPVEFAFIKADRDSYTNPERAIQILDSLLPNWSRDDFLTYNKTRWLLKAGRRQEATRIIDETYANTPGDIVSLYRFANMEYYIDNYEKSEEWLDKIDSLYLGNAKVIKLRMRIAFDKSQYEKAFTYLDSLYRQYPLMTSLFWYYRDLYQNDNCLDQLPKITNAFHKNNPKGFSALLDLAMNYSILDEDDSAINIIQPMITQYPSSAEVRFIFGLVNKNADNFDLAEKYFNEAQLLDPYTEKYHQGLLSTTYTGETLSSYSHSGEPDSIGLSIFSVDSILQLAQIDSVPVTNLGAVNILNKEQIINRNEYNRIRRYHYIIKCLTDESKDYYGNVEFGFNSWKETPYLLMARVIYENGEVQNVKLDNAYIAANDEGSSTDSRILTWSFPNVKKGAIIEYIVQFEQGHAEAFGLYDSDVLMKFDPIVHFRREIWVPVDWKFHFNHSPGISYQSHDSSGYRLHVWSVSNQPGFIYEESSPSYWEQGEKIFAGYEKSWKEEADWHWNKIKGKFTVNDDLRKLASELTDDSEGELGKIRDLFNFVSRDIRYVPIEFGEGGIIPRLPGEILENSYGDCKDKSTLMVSLLNCLDIEALPALINNYDTASFCEEIPDIAQFNHMIVYLPNHNGLFVDPTCDECDYDDFPIFYKDKPVLLINSKLEQPLLKTTSPETADNEYFRAVRVFPRDDLTTDIDIFMRISGSQARYLKSQYRHADTNQVRELVNDYCKVGLWNGAKFINYDLPDSIWHPGSNLSWTANMTIDSLFSKDYTAVQSNFWFYSLDHYLLTPDTLNRKLDFLTGAPFKITESYTVIPGPKWELNNYRYNWQIDTTWYSVNCSYKEWADSLNISVEFEMDLERISVEEIAEFVKSIQLLKKRVLNTSPLYRRAPNLEKIASLEAAVSTQPEDASILIALAQEYISNDNGGSRCEAKERREKAREILSQIYTQNSDNEAIMMQLAAQYVIDAHFRIADSIISSYEDKHKLSAQSEYLQSAIFLSLGKYEKAADGMIKVMSQMSGDNLRYYLLQAYCGMSKFEDARSQIELLKTLRADSNLVMQALYTYYMELDSLDKVKEIIDQWPDTNKTIISSLMTGYYQKTHEYDQALKETLFLLKDEPDNPLLMNNAAWFMAKSEKDLDRALELINNSLEIIGICTPGELNTRGLVYLKMGRIDEAIADFKAALISDDIHSQTLNYYFLGQCAQAQGNIKEALEFYNLAAEYNGDKDYVRMAQEEISQLKQ